MNQSQQLRNSQGHPPRAKEPTDLQLRQLKSTLQTLPLPPRHNIYYNLSTKQSKSGFFSNDRLIILNTQQKVLGYLSKVPQYKIPFYNQEEVTNLKYKAKLGREQIKSGQVKEFRCQPLHGKVATFEVYYQRGNRGDVEHWIMEMKNPKLMHQWVELINNTLLKDEEKEESVKEEPVKEEPPMQVIEEEPSQPSSKLKMESNKVLNQYRQNQNQYLQPEQPQSNLNNSIIHMSNVSNEQPSNNQNSSRIANMPYYDHVTELKYLRKQQPQKFNTSNVLSHKKLPETEEPIKVEKVDEIISGYQREVESGDYGKKSYYEEAKIEPYPVRNSSGQFRQRQPSNPRYDENIQSYEDKVYRDSKKRLSNSYLVSQPRNSRNLSPLPHEKSIYESGDQYKRYNEEEPHKIEPQITVSRPQELPRYPSQVSQRSSKPNITIEDKHRNIPNVIIEEPSTPSNDLRPERAPAARVNNFMSRGSNKDFKSSRSQQNSRRGLTRKRWNEIFAQTSNKLQIYQQFVHSCYNLVRDIVNQLPLDANRKDYLPIEARPPYYIYHHEGILLTLHRLDTHNSSSTPTIVPNAPLLFDQVTYQLLKRQFYNYNLILAVTANQGFIKVPLCAYFEYKGILALCKAQIPQSFSEVTPQRYQQQFTIIQDQIHLRFIFGAFNTYSHPNGKYVLLDNMNELVPEIPVGNKDGHFFRKEFLLSSPKMLQDVNDIHEANDLLVNQVVPQILNKLQSFEVFVVNESDLIRLFHDQGLSLAYLPHMVQLTTSPFLKRLLITELVTSIFVAIFRSQLHNLYESFQKQYAKCTLEQLNSRLMDSTHVLLDMLFGYSNQGEQMWKIIVQQCKIKYRVSVSKQDLVAGYLLGSVIERIGLNCNFRHSSFNKYEVDFFAKPNNIPRDLMLNFRIKVRRFDLASLSPLVQDIQETLNSPPTPQNFKALVNSLNLKQDPIPNYLEPLQEQILTYLCNFVPYSQHDQYQHLGIYNMVLLEPHTYYSTKCSLLAIKWCIKKKYIEEALKIYEMKELQNAFWQGQYNPAITQFYDMISMFYAQNGQYDHSVQLARMSLKNVMKVSGPSAIPVADKHYLLGNIYFKMGKKQEALKEYSRTRDILQAHNQTHIPELGVILLKLAVLYLNFGKVPEAVNHSLQALNIFDSNFSPEEDQIGTFEVLARCYEIIKKPEELQRLCSLVAQKFNQTENCLTFCRMIKISLYSSLKNLSTPEAKAFLTIITKLEKQCSNYSQIEAFSYLNKICQSEILMKKVDHYLENIIHFNEQSQRKDLFRRYKSLDLNPRNEVQEMLIIFEALGLLIGFEFMVGSLGEFYD